MPRPEKPVTATGQLAVLALWLRAQRQHAGLTYAQLAAHSGYHATTLQRAASGDTLPKLDVVLEYAAACNSDHTKARNLWHRAHRQLQPDAHGQMRPELVTTFAELHTAMRALRAVAGMPSLRELEQRAGGHGKLPHSSIHRFLTKKSKINKRLYAAFLDACQLTEGHKNEWLAAWDRLEQSALSLRRLDSRTHRTALAPPHSPTQDAMIIPPGFEEHLHSNIAQYQRYARELGGWARSGETEEALWAAAYSLCKSWESLQGQEYAPTRARRHFRDALRQYYTANHLEDRHTFQHKGRTPPSLAPTVVMGETKAG